MHKLIDPQSIFRQGMESIQGRRRIIRGFFLSGLSAVIPLLAIVVLPGGEGWPIFLVPIIPIACTILGVGVADIIQGIVLIARAGRSSN